VVKEYGGDPLAAAAAYAAAGLKWLHLVDVDLAFTGTPANLGVAAAIHARCPEIAIQASGGFALRADVERYLDIGASRVVIGSAALADRESAEALIATYFDVVVVGIETEGP